MIDMLVRLYDLPESRELYEKVEESGVILRRPGAYEKHLVANFIREHFRRSGGVNLRLPAPASRFLVSSPQRKRKCSALPATRLRERDILDQPE